MKRALEIIGQANFDKITEWVQLLDSLASDADALAADEPHCAADQTSYSDRWCALGDRWFSLLWASMTPAFIAQSARRARAELRPVELQLQDHLTDEQKAADTKRAVAMNRPAPQTETPEKQKPEPADWGNYSERKRAEREAAVIAQQERIMKVAPAAAVPLVKPAAVPLVKPAAVPQADEVEPIEDKPAERWVTAAGLAEHLNISQSLFSGWKVKGLFDGLTRSPAAGERGQQFQLEQCCEAYANRPLLRAPAAESEVIEPQVDETVEPIEDKPEPDPDELPAAWRFEPAQPDLTGAVWVSATELAIALGITQSRVDKYRRAGVFDGMWRLPAFRRRGALYALEQCRVAVGPLNCPAPAPLPVTIEPLPPAVEPSAPAPTPAAAADAAALLELAGGDDATLAALRNLLGCAPV